MDLRRRVVAALFATVIALAVPASSTAAAPVLTSAGSTQRHPWATWTLPPGVESEVIEIAIRPDTGYDGYFVGERAVVFGLLRPDQTSWLDARPLEPGTYYVHVKGADFRGCAIVPQGACDSFWSNTLTLTIAESPGKVVYAPGCVGKPHYEPRTIPVACGRI